MISIPDVVARLDSDGISLVDPMTYGEVADILAHLDACTVYNGHVKAKADKSLPGPVYAQAARWPMWTVDMHDVITAPHLFEAALESYPIARDYFREEPVLYSMNAFWTHPSEQLYMDTHGWHNDGDDRKQLVLFIYGTDVLTAENGGHLYQVGTHYQRRGYALNAAGPQRLITGTAGTAFMSDTTGQHVGIRPNQLRMLMWARWGVSTPPISYHWDRLSPCPRERLGDRYPQDPELQRVVRFVVQ